MSSEGFDVGILTTKRTVNELNCSSKINDKTNRSNATVHVHNIANVPYLAPDVVLDEVCFKEGSMEPLLSPSNSARTV